MEPLAVANTRSAHLPVHSLSNVDDYFLGYYHPLTIGIWAVLTYAFVDFMDWWPSSQSFGGVLALLSPLPALAAMACPIMFYFDW